ncbi:hypothetical protein BCR35DRAFT_65809 [Leucosporidium creatinivorum]|uniref:BTB domain-containing protein n=1 Tax=Leucosporidium creatinivorum TaxID=106004 RepID=A0A1Y2FK09_9BASI|nr:hypothetical protein BCR35DRAFT_65809 [Leucosporidium creatinivorum]
MSTLKSALRFPQRGPPPSAELPPVPFDLCTPTPQPRQLTSRFSAETLIVKSPPLLQRMRKYTQDHSPPTSPLRSSRLGHAASASESRINILNTADMIGDEGSSEQEVLSPRATKAASGGGHWGVGAAREVFEALGGKRHGRSGSGQSGKSVGSTRERPSSPTRQRASRSFSSPSGSVSPKGLSPPPRPRRVGPTPPKRAPLPAPRTVSPTPSTSKLVDLPPRSDSRNACAPPKLAQLYQAPRPHSPPSVSVPPLNIQHRTPPTRPSPPPPTPFRALLVHPPSTRVVRSKSFGSLLVNVNVGGNSYRTSMETLTRPDRGAGKLGEFVEAVVEEVKAEAERKEQETAQRTADSRHDSSLYPSSDDGESILNPSHFAMSPYPSPFPFMRYDDPLAADADLSLDLDLDRIPISPTSPIDPHAQKLFLPLPPFAAPPPPLANKQQGQLVHSPTPRMRIKSVHPDIVPSPTTPRPTRPTSLDSTCSSRRADEDDADRRDLSARLDLSRTSSLEINPFERALGPFFEVLHGQRTESDFTGSPTSGGSTSPTSVERESMGVPIDIGEHTLEDQSRSTLLGVPRGSVRRTKGRKVSREQAPEVPKLKLMPEETETGSRPPSLSHSLSTDEEGATRVDKEDEEGAGFEVFLDRAGETFGAVLHWLRDGVLPSSLSLPHSTASRLSSTPDIDSTVLSLLSLQPSSAITLLSSLRTLSDEATWLGMEKLAAACEVERERVVEVVKWLEEERRRTVASEEREKRMEVMKEREKAGWI